MPDGNDIRSKPPGRLIDPEGEGVYLLVGDMSWSLRQVAWDFFGDARRWRDFDYATVWMREGEDDHWYPSRWRWWYGFLPERWWPVVAYAYLTPKPGAL